MFTQVIEIGTQSVIQSVAFLTTIALSNNGEVGFLQRLEILDELEMGFGGAIPLGVRCFLGDIFGLHLDPIRSRLLGMGGRNGLVIVYCPAPLKQANNIHSLSYYNAGITTGIACMSYWLQWRS